MNIKSYINPRSAFLLSMILIGVGLTTSNIFMSWGQFGLAIAFVWDGKYKTKFVELIQNKRMLALMVVFILFVLGLIHTSNYAYAFHDLKIKLPLLIIPFLTFSFFPFAQKEFKIILHSIFGGVLFTMAFGCMIYIGWIDWEIKDMRNYSPFISNVRLGTLLVFCMIASSYFIFHKEYLYINKYFYVLFALICLSFLLFIQSLTGIVVLIGCLFVLVIYGLSKKQKLKISILMLLFFLLIVGTITGFTIKEYNRIHQIEKIDLSHLPVSTPDGAIYKHDLQSRETINGHYIWIYVCNWELKREWSNRSKLDYEGLTKKGWPVKGILIRYLTSKGLRKNAEAVKSLGNNEVKAIENGVANFLNVYPLDIRWRINQLLVELDEYKKEGDPNQRSFATRLETWKVAWSAILQSPWIGYGTGDVKDQMKKSYIETNSKLLPKYWLNPHQQYLTVSLSIGIIGLIIFIAFIFYPIIKFRKLNVLFVISLAISAISMLDEDTLETQAGCTQFIFIYVLSYLMPKIDKTVTS